MKNILRIFLVTLSVFIFNTSAQCYTEPFESLYNSLNACNETTLSKIKDSYSDSISDDTVGGIIYSASGCCHTDVVKYLLKKRPHLLNYKCYDCIGTPLSQANNNNCTELKQFFKDQHAFAPSMTGVIKISSTVKPAVQNVEIRVKNSDGTYNAANTRTNKSGQFTINDVPSDATVILHHELYPDLTYPAKQVPKTIPLTAITFDINATVVDADDNTPISGATVTHSTYDNKGDYKILSTKKTNDSGQFTLTNVQKNTYLKIEASDYKTKEFSKLYDGKVPSTIQLTSKTPKKTTTTPPTNPISQDNEVDDEEEEDYGNGDIVEDDTATGTPQGSDDYDDEDYGDEDYNDEDDDTDKTVTQDSGKKQPQQQCKTTDGEYATKLGIKLLSDCVKHDGITYVNNPPSTEHTRDITDKCNAICQEKGWFLVLRAKACDKGYTLNKDKDKCIANTKKQPADTPSQQSATDEDDGTRSIYDVETADKRKKELEENLKNMKEKEQSLENRILGATGIATVGAGGMMALSAMAEQNADTDAEQSMRAYLATFRCDIGNGQPISGGDKNITVPASADMAKLVSEYKERALALKSAKEALGIKPGIESEIVLDSATTGLYDDVGRAAPHGAFTSLSRALRDASSADATEWQAQKDATHKKLVAGATIAGIGAVGTMAANIAINHNNKNKADDILQNNKPGQIQIQLPPVPCSSIPGTTGQGNKPNCQCKDAEHSIYTAESGCTPCGNNMIVRNNQCVCDEDSVPDGNGGCNKCGANMHKDNNQCVCNSDENYVPDGNGGCKKCADDRITINGICKCLPAFTEIDGRCEVSEQEVPEDDFNCSDIPGAEGTIGNCHCKSGYAGNPNSSKGCTKCGTGYIPNEGQTQCICDVANGYYGNGRECKKCPDQQKPNAAGNACICQDANAHMNSEDKCIICNSDEKFNEKTNSCECTNSSARKINNKCTTCGTNMHFNDNNKCVCNDGYESNGSNECKQRQTTPQEKKFTIKSDEAFASGSAKLRDGQTCETIVAAIKRDAAGDYTQWQQGSNKNFCVKLDGHTDYDGFRKCDTPANVTTKDGKKYKTTRECNDKENQILSKDRANTIRQCLEKSDMFNGQTGNNHFQSKGHKYDYCRIILERNNIQYDDTLKKADACRIVEITINFGTNCN